MERLPEDIIDRGLLQAFDVAGALQRRLLEQQPYGFDVSSRSSLGADDRASNPYQVSHGVTAALVAATEHIDAVRALLLDAQLLHPSAPFTLIRAAIENAATAVWLLVGPSRPERVVRRLRQVLRDAMDGNAAAVEFGLKPGRPVETRKRELLSMARKVRGDAAYKLRPSETTEIVRSAEAAVRSKVNVMTAWRACAGFSHGRLWPTLSVLDREVEATDASTNVRHVRVTNSKDRVLWALKAAQDVLDTAAKRLDQQRVPHI